MMKDPHIVALLFDIETAEWIGYRAPPIEIRRGDIEIRVADDQVRFTFEGPHFATPVEARESIRDLIRLWEIIAGLTYGPGAFVLKYKDAELIDRASKDKRVRLASDLTASIRIGGPGARAFVTAYPEPPKGMLLTDTIELIYDRYARYRQGKEPLATIAYFCITWMERAAKGSRGKRRKAAADYFYIDCCFLNTVGDLSSEKGGIEARKAAGALIGWTNEEKRWLKSATTILIHRIIDREIRPNGQLPQITMADLPPL